MITSVADTQRTDRPHWPVPEERRTVTVLFADIVGSTALVDRLDPEDVRALQRAYFDTVADVLRRWHGVVEKYVGDAVMALFGARHSDGFDAYRAVRAGLEIQAALDRRPILGDITLRVRVGVATGEAVVDLGGAVSGGHGVASGAVITTAARLQEYAAPGAVALCAATARATAGLIVQRQLAPVPVAGRVPPMAVWHAAGLARPGAGRHDGPLIGRRRELAGITDQVMRALHERDPRWLSLVGPSGSGRSRLLHELARALRTVDGMPVRWCVVGCPPYPDQVLAPIADLVRGVAGIRRGDGPATVRDRLTDTLTPLYPAGRIAGAVAALQALLTTPDGSAGALAAAAICRDALLRLAAHRPLVVAVDDVDRAAPAVSRFLHGLFAAAAARGLPLAVLTVHQPQWADTRPGPARRVPIRPLATVQSGRLLRHLLTRAGQTVALVDRLLPLAGGRPGHAAAYVASIAAGADPTALPDSVRRHTDAELDRLDGERRAVLMAAGTLPGVLSGAAVDRALGWTPGRSAPLLRALVAAGLLRQDHTRGYAFVAPTLRQVAAERLPRAMRAVFAGRAAASPPGVAHPGADRRTQLRRNAGRSTVRAAADRTAANRAVATHATPMRAAANRATAVHDGAVPVGAGAVGTGPVESGPVEAGAVGTVVGGAGGGWSVGNAEIVRLDAVRARAGGLDTRFAAPPSGSVGPAWRHRRVRTPTMATPPAAPTRGSDSPPVPRRLRAVASAGDVPPTATSHRPPTVVERPLPSIRAAGARVVPRPPSARRSDGLAASA
ncbi:adenylate/guanylate cyclase domain-containing protein [Micromonospora lupini]|uniref:Adenylate/guanylate cyclase n=1 Tax=Micromonospora lupini str. Lupac 08 TaxID=1150864 RepID=I0L537_9ACTN|nr:adenylate/guanylate cyclase domain-containing protein [Micromonospora lupini]CCH18934.1 Adenylate/guanylate cyclase [Micromonospora lupini str. Lupac 08]